MAHIEKAQCRIILERPKQTHLILQIMNVQTLFTIWIHRYRKASWKIRYCVLRRQHRACFSTLQPTQNLFRSVLALRSNSTCCFHEYFHKSKKFVTTDILHNKATAFLIQILGHDQVVYPEHCEISNKSHNPKNRAQKPPLTSRLLPRRRARSDTAGWSNWRLNSSE